MGRLEAKNRNFQLSLINGMSKGFAIVGYPNIEEERNEATEGDG
ncbi:hypothetical protein RBI80_29415 (plasmid) [Klebsiella variicola]|nr:hypothetical protein RBI80_29415 [Klebsiella variicola]